MVEGTELQIRINVVGVSLESVGRHLAHMKGSLIDYRLLAHTA